GHDRHRPSFRRKPGPHAASSVLAGRGPGVCRDDDVGAGLLPRAARSRPGLAPSGALCLPAARRPRTRGQGAGADGDTALPQVPESVDRRQRRADGGRHAPSGAHADRRRRGSRGDPRLADRTLRRLRQLQAYGQRDDLAAVCGPGRTGAARAADPAAAPEEGAMTWLVAIALALAAFAVAAFALRLEPSGWTTVAAALALGLAGYAMQASPDVPGAPSRPADELDGMGGVLCEQWHGSVVNGLHTRRK